MKITVTFDSLEEFAQHMRTMEGFAPEKPVVLHDQGLFEAAKAAIKALAAEEAQEAPAAPEGFEPADSTPFDEKPAEAAAPAVTEDYRMEVRKFLAKLNKQTGKNTAKELISQFGAGKLTDIRLEDLPALMEKAKEAADA